MSSDYAPAGYEGMSDEAIYEAQDDCATYLGESEIQYSSEVSLYGDAWPGAREEIRHATACYAEIEAEMTRRAALRAPVAAPVAAPAPVEIEDDIPF